MQNEVRQRNRIAQHLGPAAGLFSLIVMSIFSTSVDS